jgi:YYY domain-containing protein
MIQNLPGPITLQIQEADGEYNQPLPFPRDTTLRAGTPYNTSFTAHADGILEEVYLPHVVDQRTVPDLGSLLLTISAAAEENTGLAKAILPAGQIPKEPPGEDVIFLSLDQPLEIVKGKSYSLGLQVVDGLDEVKLCGPVNLEIQTPDVLLTQTIPPPLECVLQTEAPYAVTFTANFTGTLSQATISQLSMVEIYEPFNQELTLSITQQLDGEPLATGSVASDFTPGDDRRGDPYRILLDRPVVLTKGEVYHLGLSIEGGQGEIKLSGTALANETTWDDGLPLRMDGYDPYGGIYQGDLNFEMYWDDNQEKLDRFISTLDQADYVLITSSRQWGSTTRVPERYPLTSHYYRNLVGCPAERSIEWCYNVARPGEFQGELGFDLVKVFQSDPSIGSWRINDQFAEEAFTVYDHPKVLVFQKSENYDPLKVRELLGQVDLSQVIHVTPRQADSNPGNLMLPLERLTEQRTGGTWSDLFNSDAPHNRYKILGVLVWYLSVSVLGLLTYPLLRYVLPGLSDRGYPLARIAGMLILAWFVWLAGSARIPFTRLTIGAVLMLMTLLGGVLAYRQRDELRREWQEQRKYFLIVEGLTLAFFLVGLLIRFGNPDLWHPWKGGEKPMDFSYFNAVLKSTSFPPYDPWFAGGYINYYYYGFVIVGVLVKFLGIVPAFAYNLIMPTLLSMIAMGAFSAVWNLTRESTIGNTWSAIFRSPRLWLSVGGSMGMAVLGNLGVVRMFYRGFQTIAAPGVELETVGFWKKLIWFIEGVFKALTGSPLPYRVDEWYWNPSRVIDAAHGNPITEFPFFTFLYGDMHAHLFALPIALLVIGWVLSVVLGRAWARERARSPFQVVLSLVVGGIAIGALYPVNLSDIYTYLPLGVVAAAYAIFRYAGQQDYTIPLLSRLPKKFTVLLFSLGSVVALVGFSRLFYQPYAHWYGQGYDEVEIWAGTHTPLSDYLVMWGLFLFIIVSWLVYESIDWMAKTPVSALRRLEPYREAIFLIIIFILMITLGLGIDLNLESPIDGKLPLGLGIHVAWLVLPLGTWAGVLLLRPDMPDPKRVVLFFIGTGLVITLVVEVVTVTGDIGRMNTVFKYYLQAWTLFAVSAAAALGWMLKSISRWSLNLRTAWQMLLIALVVSTALYPLFASLAKIDDRMAEDAPMTLDGMAYMKYATYHDFDTALDLNQDYEAIRWLQENVEGSPVIVEAHVVEYHWGTRYTIYTGLPGVVGWNWHQRQQRTTVSHEWVFDRVDAVHNFYQTTDLNVAVDFLKEYDVRYVILGQLERAEYPGPGLDKFAAQEGNLWRQVYNQQDTVIYEVLP